MTRLSWSIISFLFITQAAFAEENLQQNASPNWSLGAGLLSPSASIERRFGPKFFIGAQFSGEYKIANAYELELIGDRSGQFPSSKFEVPESRRTTLSGAILPRWILTDSSSPVEISALGSFRIGSTILEGQTAVGGILSPNPQDTDSLNLSAGAGIAAEYKFNSYLALRASTILGRVSFERWMKLNRNELGAKLAFEPALDLRFYF